MTGTRSSPDAYLLSQCVAFLNRVRTFAPGLDQRKLGPQPALAQFLRAVERYVRNLPDVEDPEVDCNLVALVPAGQNVIEQLSEIWKGPKPNLAWILSPFFDVDNQVSATAATFAGLLTTRGRRELTFVGPGGRLPDGTVQIDISSELKRSSHPSLAHHFSFVPARIELNAEEINRPLHAKSIWLQSGSRALCMVGSSNFTAAGLGLHGKHNIELNVAYLINDIASRFGRTCSESWPSNFEIDDPNAAQFLGGKADSAENEEVFVLPGAFGLALFCLDSDGARLDLEIGSNAPTVFEIRCSERNCLMDADRWLAAGKRPTIAVPWNKPRPPSALRVYWRGEEEQACEASWVVNVADTSALPPPDELSSLSLAELMEILTSARPMHEVVIRMLERREKKSAIDRAVHMDSHKKVDSSQFLLARMRRVARALEGSHLLRWQ